MTTGTEESGAAGNLNTFDGSRTYKARLVLSLINTKIVLVGAGGAVGTNILIVTGSRATSFDRLADNFE